MKAKSNRILFTMVLVVMLCISAITVPAQAATESYVLNTNTHKFHRPGCASVAKMKDSNRQDVSATRDEIIGQGYDPCKNCKP